MAFTQNQIATRVKQPKLALVQILPADTTAAKTAVTAGTSGSKVTSVNVASTDTSTKDIQIGVSRSGTFYPLGTVTVAITAGFVAGTPSANLLDPTVIKGLSLDNDGNWYLNLESGDTLDFKALVAVNTSKAISITVNYGDY